MNEDFEVIGRIEQVQTIAVGNSIREIRRLRKTFGQGRWRKRKETRPLNLKMVQFTLSNCIGTKRTVSVGKN